MRPSSHLRRSSLRRKDTHDAIATAVFERPPWATLHSGGDGGFVKFSAFRGREVGEAPAIRPEGLEHGIAAAEKKVEISGDASPLGRPDGGTGRRREQ